MTTSSNGIKLLQSLEGCSLKAYKFPGEAYYTIGYGHSYDNSITANTKITKAQAIAYLKNDLVKFERYVDQYVPILLTQNMFDGLVSYAYNRGLGGLKELVENSKTASDYAQNIVIYWGSAKQFKGALISRRKKEQMLFITDMYLEPQTSVTVNSYELFIRWLQTMLNRQNKSNLLVDGVYGDCTSTAVLDYWKSLGWNKAGKADGLSVGSKTINKLIAMNEMTSSKRSVISNTICSAL